MTLSDKSPTTSFPYFAIARRNNVPYSMVLEFAGLLDDNPPPPLSYAARSNMENWAIETADAWVQERNRRIIIGIYTPSVTAEELHRAAALKPASFPYLTVSRTRNVRYGWILKFVDSLDECPSISVDEDLSTWQRDTVAAWSMERKRRRGDLIIAEAIPARPTTEEKP